MYTRLRVADTLLRDEADYNPLGRSESQTVSIRSVGLS
jgi:hypothetical protein